MRKKPKFIPSKDRGEYNIDYNTSNKSFLDVSTQLENYGIQNKTFMLRLYDQSLVHVDPYHAQDDEIKSRIVRECERNIWYFFREVVRVPVQGGGTIPFKLDFTSCAQIYLFEKNMDSWVTKSRFLFKSTTCQLLCKYTSIFPLLSDRTYNELINIYTINKVNISRHNRILYNSIPPYMKFSNVNSKITKLPGMESKLKYIEMCDFQDMPTLAYFPDTEYIKDIDEAYHIISTVMKGENSDSLIISESTICDESNAENILQHSLIWKNEFYDTPDWLLYDLFSNYDNKKEIDGKDIRLFHINFSYTDLGYDERWYKECARMLNNDYEAIRREILCERKK